MSITAKCDNCGKEFQFPDYGASDTTFGMRKWGIKTKYIVFGKTVGVSTITAPDGKLKFEILCNDCYGKIGKKVE